MSTVEDVEVPAPADEAPVAASALRRLVRLVVVSAVVAVVMGVAWELIAPTPRYVVTFGGLQYGSELPGEYWAMDGWFAVLGLVAGVLIAVYVLTRRDAGLLEVVTVAITGVLGSLLAWWVGHVLGPSHLPAYSGLLIRGTVEHGPLTIGAKGVLLAWPIAALMVLMFGLAWQSSSARSAEDIAAANAERHGTPSEDEPGGAQPSTDQTPVDDVPGDDVPGDEVPGDDVPGDETSTDRGESGDDSVR